MITIEHEATNGENIVLCGLPQQRCGERRMVKERLSGMKSEVLQLLRGSGAALRTTDSTPGHYSRTKAHDRQDRKCRELDGKATRADSVEDLLRQFLLGNLVEVP